MDDVKKVIAKTFLELSDALATGQFGHKPVIGLACEAPEHGENDLSLALKIAESKNLKPVRIEGDDPHKVMEKMLEAGEIDACVTMHYPFPIGVSTVGKVITPAFGKPMYIANTTGTSDSDRVCAMILNAVYGIITAKADGVENPTVGIANIDGARQAEKALVKLQENGYDISFSNSARADGGIVMRGNDLLMGTPDIMVMDSLTGNLMMKVFSSFTSGGNYETTGFGYGPGVGEGFDKLIMIVSRASGAPVIASAMEYAANLIRGDFFKIAKEEFAKAKKAGLNQIIADIKAKSSKPAEKTEEIKIPEKEVVTAAIPGIEVMDLEEATKVLWKSGIYAESGMGCTGPVILVSQANLEKATGLLKEADYIG